MITNAKDDLYSVYVFKKSRKNLGEGMNKGWIITHAYTAVYAFIRCRCPCGLLIRTERMNSNRMASQTYKPNEGQLNRMETNWAQLNNSHAPLLVLGNSLAHVTREATLLVACRLERTLKLSKALRLLGYCQERVAEGRGRTPFGGRRDGYLI